MANYNSSHTGAEIDSAIGRVKDTAVTAGTVSASLGVVVDANKDISGFRNVTLTGQLQAATINLTGDTTIGDGDTDNITINADVNSNIIPNTDNTFDLGSASKQWKDLYVNGIGYIDQLGTDADPIAIYASSGEIDGTAIGSESASTGAFTTISASGNVDFNGDLDVDGTTNLDVVDIDGAVDMASTLAVGTYFSLKTTDDQANSWVLYTNTNDSLEFNYNGSGNAEVVVDNSGKVGIGLTSPAYKLDLASSEAIVSQFTGSSGETILSLDNTSTNGDKWYLISGGSGGSFSGGKFGIYNADTTTAVATFTNSGNVGIGTTSPNPYSIINSTNFLTIKSSGTNQGSNIDQVATGTGFTGINMGNESIRRAAIASLDGSHLTFFTNNTNSGTTVTERMRITSDGNVGINETSPYDSNWTSSSKQLTITGADYAVLRLKDHDSNFAIGAGDGRHYMSYDRTAERHNLIADADGVLRSNKGIEFEGSALGGSQTGISSSGSGGDLLLFAGGSAHARLNSLGNLGINETNPAAKMDIDGDIQIRNANALLLNHTGGGASDTYINSPSSDVMAFRTGGSERMRITSDGELILKGTSLPTDFGNERGHLVISSVNHGSNNNYAILSLQGHSNSNSVGTGGIYFWDHSNNVAIIQADRATSESSSNLLFYTNNGSSLSERMRITDNGTVQPGANNAYNLGTTSLRWSVLYTSNSVNVSDETLKIDIQDCDLGIDFINTLKPKSFKMKDLEEKHDDYNKKHYGLIAQDLKDGKLKDSVYGDKDGDYGLAYNDLVAPLIKAVQELSAKVEALENA